MKISLRIIAYFCIATTPIQILIVLWGILVVLTSDYGFISLSQIEFINNYLTFLLPIVEWFYSWFWNAWLPFISSERFILSPTRKMTAGTSLRRWILKQIS